LWPWQEVVKAVFLDRVGPRRLMTALSLVGVIGAIVFSLADNLVMGIIGRVLLGIGMACNLMGTLKLLSEWFRPNAGAGWPPPFCA